MADDGIFNKAASIERCLRRITEEYGGNRQNLFEHQTQQDARHVRKAFQAAFLRLVCSVAMPSCVRVEPRRVTAGFIAVLGGLATHCRVSLSDVFSSRIPT